MKVEVIEIENMNAEGAKSQGCLRAYATIKIGELIIYRVKLVKQPGQKAYVTAPQFEFYGNGHVKYIPILKWPQEWHEQIFTAVYDAYRASRDIKEAEEVSEKPARTFTPQTKEN